MPRYRGGSEATAMSANIEHGGAHAWYKAEQMGGCGVVHAAGGSDAGTVRGFDVAVTEAARLSAHVVIDLTHVTFVDSSGLGALIVARNSAREGSGSMSLVSPPPMVRRLLGSTQLTDVFPIHDSLAEAIN